MLLDLPFGFSIDLETSSIEFYYKAHAGSPYPTTNV